MGVEESMKNLETLETVVSPEAEVEANGCDEAKVKAVEDPGGKVEALVSPKTVDKNMAGTDSETESVVLLEAVVETIGVLEPMVLFAVGTEKVEISVVS